MATYLNYPFNPELFNYNWKNVEDKTLTAMFESGAVQKNGEIETMISNGSDAYTVPFYNVIGGTPENYDGKTDITLTDPDGSSQSGIVYGRAHGWKEKDFVVDFNSGADPMAQVTSQVAKYWQKNRQGIMLKVLNGIFNIADDSTDNWDEFQLHTTDISSSTSTVTDANKIGATTIGDATQKALGDAASDFSLALMHSKVAQNMAGLQLLEYWKYTDEMGIERTLRLGSVNGLTVVIDDSAPVTSGKYTTYLMGLGALQYAPANVATPSEVERNATAGGGYNALITRIRETIHPNGFTFVKPSSGYTASPTDAQLGAASNWKLIAPAKNIAIARIISNG